MRYFYDGSADDEDVGAGRPRGRADTPRGADDAWLDDGARLDGLSVDDDARDDDAPDDDDDDALLDDGSLEDDFPRGDGTADTEAVAYCPYCGELNEIAVDPGGGAVQSYVEDCHVCCRPWRVAVRFDAQGRASAQLDVTDD